MKKFVDGNIDGAQFQKDFFKLWCDDRDRKKEQTSSLINLVDNEKLVELKSFATLMSETFMDCDCYNSEIDLDLKLQNSFDISEKRIKKFVLKIHCYRYTYPLI